MIILKEFKDIRGNKHYVNPQQVVSIEDTNYWVSERHLDRSIIHTSSYDITIDLSPSEIAKKLGIYIDNKG